MLLEKEMHQKTMNGEDVFSAAVKKVRVRTQVTHLLQKTKRGIRRSSASTIRKQGTSKMSAIRSLQIRRMK